MTPVRTRTPFQPFTAPALASAPRRTRIARLCRAVCAGLISGGALSAWALGLGEAQTNSHIGELLQVRIPITATPDEGVTTECIRLEGPRGESSDDLPWLRAGRLRLSTQTGGQHMLTVTSLQAIQSPAVMLAVRVDCNSTLRREYTLLLNPPAAEAPAPGLAPPARDSTSAGTWRTAPGESLRAIAQSLFPTDRALQLQYVAMLRRSNASKLQGVRDTTPLPAGTELQVPDLAELASTPQPAPRKAAAETAPAAARMADAAPAAPRDEQANRRRAAERPARQRLVVGGGDRAGLQLDTTLAGRQEMSDKDREKLRTELQLIATLDDKIANQLELSEKLRQLEALQTRLQADVQNLENRIRMQQTALQPASALSGQQAPATTTPPSGALMGFAPPWREWLWPLAGLAALALTLLGWRAYRRRGAHAPDTVDAGSVTAQDVQTADDLFEPLSEEDIWPDASAVTRAKTSTDNAEPPIGTDLGAPSVLHIVEDVEEHNSAVELAEIMMSFGRVQGAAQTLADFIRANPKQAVKPWVKLLEVYKTANMRVEFEALTSQLNKTFNVKPVTWEDFDVALRAPESLEHIGHIAQKLCDTWGKRECQAYLHMLLRDNRQGTRQGFPLAMVDEILLLLAILESHLGPYKPDVEPVEEPVAPQTTPTVSAPVTVPPAPVPSMKFVDTVSAPARKAERSSLDFDIGTTDFDLGLDTDDLTRTLHIDLDDLPDPQSTATGKSGV